jgi:diketogulonate reductase-like aldo/keto reductase
VLTIVEHIKMAEDQNITTSQITLAWIIAQGIIPILGPRIINYLEENIKAGTIVLSEDAINDIPEIAMKADKNAGNRYGPRLQETPFLDSPECLSDKRKSTDCVTCHSPPNLL